MKCPKCEGKMKCITGFFSALKGEVVMYICKKCGHKVKG
jgi:hypothetical protein